MAWFRVVGTVLAFVLAGCASFDAGETAGDLQTETRGVSELALWQSIEETENLSLIHKYLSMYPNGRFAQPARVRLLEAGPVDTPGALARGLAAYRDNQYDEALRFLWPQAELGEPLAQQKLGLMYMAGWGMDPDAVQAFKWLTLAEAGGADAARNSREFLDATMDPDQHEAALSLIEAYRPLPRAPGGGV